MKVQKFFENIFTQLIEYAQFDIAKKPGIRNGENSFDNTISNVVNSLPESIFVYDVIKKTIVYKNRCLTDKQGLPWCLCTVRNDSKKCDGCSDSDYETLVKNAKVFHMGSDEILVSSNDFQEKWYKMSVTPFECNEKGETTSELVNLTDITELKNKEFELIANQQKLTSSLEENQLLLQEIHHRVKNNLQIISGLIDLQVNRMQQNSCGTYQLKETKNRIKSIALIHEKLYHTDDFSKVDMSEYSRSLIISLANLFNIDETHIDINLQIESDIYFSIDQAVPLGLMINEIISNCYKHAFNDDKEGSIWVSFVNMGDNIFLEIKDSGKGIDSIQDTETSNSLGMKLIKLLSIQLMAELSYLHDEGFITRLVIPAGL